jgi:hypothetical protein
MRQPEELGFYHVYPRALSYHDPACGFTRMVREPTRRPRDTDGFSERHLHAIWYDERFRPPRLTTSTGEAVLVEHPGQWNLEAGPDFIGGVVQVGPERRRIAGDVEVHIRPADWRNHGHRDDPNYRNVKLHLTWYPGVLPQDELPPGTLQVALQPLLAHDPYFAFEKIDVTAYPYEIEGTLTPLRNQLAGMIPDEREHFLDIAGEERLRRKTLLFAQAIERLGPEQAFYEAFMSALGYKNNKTPFRILAERLPLEELRNESGGDPEIAYALMLGVSGLMPEDPTQVADAESRQMIRSAWDAWWKRAEKWENRRMEASAWTLANTRPANHPRRRMMAAAHLFTLDELISDQLLTMPTDPPKSWIKKALQLLEVNTQTYWTRRLALGADLEALPIQLIGRPRAVSMLTNIFIPFVAAVDRVDLFQSGLLDLLPSEPINSLIKQTAHAIFGPDHSSALYRTGLRRQGLIQIFYDYGIDGKVVPPGNELL